MISVGEHSACWGLPYKEGVGGSSPSTPTEVAKIVARSAFGVGEVSAGR